MSSRFLALTNTGVRSTLFSARSQALENFTTAGVPLYPAGAGSIPTIGTPAQVRAALEVTGLATKNPEAVWISNNYFASNSNNNSASINGGVDPFVDRLLNVTTRAFVTSSPAMDTSPVFDTSGNTAISLASGGQSTIEIDFTNGGAGFAFLYTSGLICFSFYDYHPGGYLTPLSIKVEILSRQSGAGQWFDCGTVFPVDNTNAAQNTGSTLQVPPLSHLAKLRFTFTPRPQALFTLVTTIRYFANRPDNSEIAQFPLSFSTTAQTLYSPNFRFAQNAFTANFVELLDGSVLASNPAESTSPTTGAIRTIGVGIGGGSIAVGKRIQFTAVLPNSQPNQSLFLDANTGRLSFKDSFGSIFPLY
jgi:hypothetical protein